MARTAEKPSLGKRLIEWAMTAGVLVLVGGLVCAFLVAGVFILHRNLSRNEDENMVVREPAAKSAVDAKESALEDLKKPLPPPVKASSDPKSVGVKPRDLADIAPAAPKAPQAKRPRSLRRSSRPSWPPRCPKARHHATRRGWTTKGSCATG